LGFVELALSMISSPSIIAGIVSFGCSLLLWLYVLARIDVSQAYPLIALGIVITSLGGVFLLGEPMSSLRLLGTTVVIVGVVLVSLS
jgi:drug/metabolite transporter (DMT)-like permease